MADWYTYSVGVQSFFRYVRRGSFLLIELLLVV